MDSQLRKGVVELVVLTALLEKADYGGALLSRLVSEGLDISSGTLYPLLARLKKLGLIASKWEESPSGPPRKIYSVTARGRSHISELAAQWRGLAVIVESRLKGLGI